MRSVVFLLQALMLAACVTGGVGQAAPNIRNIMMDRAEHLDREVTARGYLQFTPARRGLSQTRELTVDEVEGVRADCITVWGYHEAEVQRLSRLNGKLVEIVGRFRFIPLKDDETNLWECNDYGVEIIRVSDLSR